VRTKHIYPEYAIRFLLVKAGQALDSSTWTREVAAPGRHPSVQPCLQGLAKILPPGTHPRAGACEARRPANTQASAHDHTRITTQGCSRTQIITLPVVCPARTGPGSWRSRSTSRGPSMPPTGVRTHRRPGREVWRWWTARHAGDRYASPGYSDTRVSGRLGLPSPRCWHGPLVGGPAAGHPSGRSRRLWPPETDDEGRRLPCHDAGASLSSQARRQTLPASLCTTPLMSTLHWA
jgi:hypothetical protein